MRKSKLNEIKLLKINTYFTETEPQVVSRKQWENNREHKTYNKKTLHHE